MAGPKKIVGLDKLEQLAQSLNSKNKKAINELNTNKADKTELFSGDYNDLTNKPVYDTRKGGKIIATTENSIGDFTSEFSDEFKKANIEFNFNNLDEFYAFCDNLESCVVTHEEGYEYIITKESMKNDEYKISDNFYSLQNNPWGICISFGENVWNLDRGLWFLYYDSMANVHYSYEFIINEPASGELKQLDEKFIPDTIARVKDLFYDTRETEVVEITFDGNTEGKESITDDNGYDFFKVSEMVFTEEQINMLKNDSDAIFSMTTGSSVDYKIVDMGGITDGEGVYFISTAIVIATEGNEELGFTPGVWFYWADYGYIDRLRFSSATGELKQIEEKFIPELDYNGLRNKPLVANCNKTFKYDADMEEKVTSFAPTFGWYCGVKVADVTAEETTMYIEAAAKNGCIITYEKDGVIKEDVSKKTGEYMDGTMGISTSDGKVAAVIAPASWEWYYAHNNQYVKEPGIYLVDEQIFDNPTYSHLNLNFRVLKIEILGAGDEVVSYKSEKDIYVNEDKLATEVYVDNAINNIPEGFSGDYNDLANRPCYDTREIGTIELSFDGNTEGLLTGGKFVGSTAYVRVTEDVSNFDVDMINETNTIVCRNADGSTTEFKGTFERMFSNVYYLSANVEGKSYNQDIVFILSDMYFHAPSIDMKAGIWFYNNGEARVQSLSYEAIVSGEIKVLNGDLLINSPGIKKENGAEIFNDYENNSAAGEYSHAEGSWTKAGGDSAHAEGASSWATGDQSHAEGLSTIAEGKASHAEGWGSQSNEQSSHAEGEYTMANGKYSHAEGYYTRANGESSHAEGRNTIATGNYQHVQGKYNVEDTENKFAHIVGNGTYQTPENIHTLDWDGNAWFKGNVSVEGTPVNEKDLTTKAYVDNNIKTVSDELAKQMDKNVTGSLANGITQAFEAINTNQGRLNNHDAKIAHFESQFSIINGEGVGSIKKAVSDLVDAAPTTLDTLNELAQALGDDPNFATTVSTELGKKADKEEINAQIEEIREDLIELEEDNLTMDGLIDNTYPGLVTENKTLIGAINELANKTPEKDPDEIVIKAVTQAAYDALGTKEPNVLYIIVG